MQAEGARFEGVSGFIRSFLVEHGVPSLAVAVSGGGRILWEEGFGWADREARVPATAHTAYSIASVSKPLTAAAVLVLAARGLLDVDGPVNAYLGPTPLRARVGGAQAEAAATVRRVANHTAGLPLHSHLFPEDEPARRPPMEETLRRYGNLITLPGERHRYSNLGYGVLDHVIARLSGRSYADFMRAEVFLPLGMLRSSIGRAPGLEPFQAARYTAGVRLPFYDFDHPGGSAAFASAHDLARFGAFQVGTPFPDQRAILTPAALSDGQRGTVELRPGLSYGLGWTTRLDAAGRRRVSHGGGMPGVSTILELLPEEGLAVAALANGGSNLPELVVERLLEVLLPGYAEQRDRARAAEAAPAAAAEAPFEPGELGGTWRGMVATERGDVPLELEFRADGGVHARLGAQLPTLLSDPQWREGWLTGRMAGDLGADDVRRRPYLLHTDLRLRGEALTGALVAVALPEVVLGYALAFPAELHRA